jgi:biotin transport system ATP-binding protein
VTDTIFSVRNVTKKFPNGFEALSGINLDIFEGECLLVAGANGSGKTLLMQMLAGLLEPSAGEILFRGRPLAESRRLLRRSVGLVFQDADAQILGETVEEDIRFGPENLKLPKDEIEKRLEETLAALELSSKRDFAPRSLSGGEKRRLAAAGVLVMGCEGIIMDEPFANLAWPGVTQVLNIINNLKKTGKTIIILTHELEKVLALADRLVILAGGKIRDSGESGAVLNRLDPAWGVRDPRRVYSSAEDCTWL